MGITASTSVFPPLPALQIIHSAPRRAGSFLRIPVVRRHGSPDLQRRVKPKFHYTGRTGKSRGFDFRTIARCRDCLKNPRDKSAISPFASGKRRSRRRRGQINGDVTGVSRTCRGRHEGSWHNGIWALSRRRCDC